MYLKRASINKLKQMSAVAFAYERFDQTGKKIRVEPSGHWKKLLRTGVWTKIGEVPCYSRRKGKFIVPIKQWRPVTLRMVYKYMKSAMPVKKEEKDGFFSKHWKKVFG